MSHPIHTRLQRILGKKIFAHDARIDGELSVTKDTDSVSWFGRAYVGYGGSADHANFGHIDQQGATNNYALRQSAGGTTYINTPTGQTIHFRVNNVSVVSMVGDGVSVAQPITLTGDGRVHKHLWVSVTTFRPSGAQLGNQGINTHLIFRDNFDDIAFYDGHVPYERQIGTDMDVELIWYYTGGNQAGNCLWNVTYDSVAHEGGDPTGAGTALTQQAVNIATDDTTGHLHFTVPGAVMDDHDNMFLKVWRNGNDDLDTLGTNALLLGAHLHFLTDKIGEAV